MELIQVKRKEMKVLDFELNLKTLVQQGQVFKSVFKSKCHPNPFNCSNNLSLRAPDNDVKCKHLTILCLFRLFRFHNWILQLSRSLDGFILFIIQTPISRLTTFVTWLSTLLKSFNQYFLLQKGTHKIHHFNHFEVYNLVAFTMLCSHHHDLVPEHF